MVKRLVVTLFVLAVFLFAPQGIQSQEITELDKQYDLAFDEYQLALDNYTSIHEDYVLARSQYLRFQTLTSQNNAKTATRQMLEARDEAIIKYLGALRMKLVATQSSDTQRSARLISQIDEEVNWFVGHKELLGSAGSLEDLVADSKEASDRYTLFDSTAYETLSFVPYSHVVRLEERLRTNFAEVRSLISQIRDESRPDYKFDTEKLERIDKWVYDTEAKMQRGDEKITISRTTMDTINAEKTKENSRIYDQMLRELAQSIQDLKDASLYTREIIKEIKTK